jgi:predicted XRE-type DNA-binding protein
MGAIKDHLEAQGQRHDQLISHLSHLPKVMDLIPETSRVQSETLKAIHQQLEQQNISQRQLANILERISQTGGDQRKILDSLRERMDMLNEHDQVIADNLTGFGAAMQSVSRNSQTSAQVLEQLRDNMARRDDQIETILKSYNSRFIILLSVVSFFAIGAFLSVIYLLWNRPVDERFITPRMPTPITTSPTTQGG